VNYLDILEALISQQTLQRSQLQARRELLQFRIDLCRALGSGWELSKPEAATLKKAELNENDQRIR
jgi:outer membrane protein TolC